MMRLLYIARAFICFHIVGLIGFVVHYVPRSPGKARFVNALTGPFFGPAAWWALTHNPSFKQAMKKAQSESKQS
jgi:hypothetical protein